MNGTEDAGAGEHGSESSASPAPPPGALPSSDVRPQPGPPNEGQAGPVTLTAEPANPTRPDAPQVGAVAATDAAYGSASPVDSRPWGVPDPGAHPGESVPPDGAAPLWWEGDPRAAAYGPHQAVANGPPPSAPGLFGP
ncbi:MAG: hypothetical protein H0X35_08505, partial [Pseudonocardiales bacterium]|nr:hypothetical protein [Pseudonocardiales bacterium]